MTDDPRIKLPRDELDDLAQDAGVEQPERLPNKQAVIDALPNPALEPEPVERVARTYRVVGSRRVYDTPPGGTFKRLLTVDQEWSLTEAGHITPEPEES